MLRQTAKNPFKLAGSKGFCYVLCGSHVCHHTNVVILLYTFFCVCQAFFGNFLKIGIGDGTHYGAYIYFNAVNLSTAGRRADDSPYSSADFFVRARAFFARARALILR